LLFASYLNKISPCIQLLFNTMHLLLYFTDVVNRAAFRVALGSRGTSHSASSTSYHSSRRSSEDSSEDGIVSIRDMRVRVKTR